MSEAAALNDVLRVERDSTATILTLNRRAKLNALDIELTQRLTEAVVRASTDGSRLIVFQGAGQGFSGGFDLSELESQSDGDLAVRLIRIEMLLQEIHHTPIATLALTHGPCYGAAADLVAACHRAVASADSRFRMPGLRFSAVLGTRRLSQKVGTDAARALLQTSGVFDASEALRIGFVHEIRARDEWSAVIEESKRAAERLDRDAQRSLYRNTVTDTRDADLAALARSVARAGLKQRIQAYLGTEQRDRGAPAAGSRGGP